MAAIALLNNAPEEVNYLNQLSEYSFSKQFNLFLRKITFHEMKWDMLSLKKSHE